MFGLFKKKPEEPKNTSEAHKRDVRVIEFGTTEKATKAEKERMIEYVAGGNNPANPTIEKYFATSELINACVRYIAETAGQAEPKLFQQTPDGELVPVNDAKLQEWIAVPNPLLTWNTLLQLTIQGMLLSGNGYLTFEMVKGRIETWFLTGSKVDVVPDKSKFVAGYIFDDKIPYKTKEVIHFKIPSLNNVYYGVSPVASLLDTLSLEAYALEELTEMYERGVLLKGVLEPEFMVSDSQIETLREQFNELYSKNGGYRNGVAVLPHNMKFHPISMTATESSLLDSLNISEERVLQVFKMNKLVLGGMDTGGTHLKEVFVAVITTAVLPYIRMMEAQFTLFLRQFYKDNSLVFKLDIDGLTFVESAFEQKANSLKTLFTTGVLSLNETRAMLNLPKVDSERADKHGLPAYLVGSEVTYAEDPIEDSSTNTNFVPAGSTDPDGGKADVGVNPDNNSNNS